MSEQPATPGAPLRELPPSGTVTFAFTDIEGSTKRWERDRAAMGEALRRHDAVMRATIERHGGYVFKTIGDAFCASFHRPEDAVGAMLAAQRALGAEDFAAVDGIAVRAAVHTGTADERDGDYFGPVVNRVARLLAIGHGGQVLVSETTAAHLHGTLPAGAGLRDLGEHRLKDLTRPERVHQLLAPDLLADFPALRSLDARRNNLPGVLTSFLGRETEVAEIRALLGGHRIVTLVGSGGIGKTRISLQVAANLLADASDGVWFVELAPLANGAYIPTTVAQALGLTLGPEGDPGEQLVRALANKNALIIFDNCEHLIEAAAHLISALARACPNLTILASSRQPLGISGEAIYRLQSLSVPDAERAAGLAVQELSHYGATALFLERARTADGRFSATDENASAIAEICRRLDGIPLAIELAAARVKVLSPRQLRERLDERFRVLGGGSRDLLPRQQTLRALIDWSHDLLDERERALFRRLGIFANGFALEGAVAVGRGDDFDEFDVFDLLASLVDKSLVLAEEAGDALRYRLLESTRVYAREKLAAACETGSCAQRHVVYLRERLVEAEASSDLHLHEVFAAELEDVRSALDAALVGDSRAGAELLDAIRAAWGIVGLYGEGLSRTHAFLSALPESEPGLRARLSIVVAMLAANSGRTGDAFAAATRGLEFARASGEPVTLASALGSFAWSAARLRRFDEAQAALAEAASIADVPPSTRRRLLEARAFVSGQSGDLASAVNALELLQTEYRSIGDGPSELAMAQNLAEMEHERGQTRHAIEILEEMLPRYRADRDRTGLVQVLGNLTGYYAAVDDLPAAYGAAREAIGEFAAREPDAAFVAVAIEHLALALALGGELRRAALLCAYAENALHRHGYEREFTERTSRERLVAILRAQFAPNDLDVHLAAGAALESGVAIALALETG